MEHIRIYMIMSLFTYQDSVQLSEDNCSYHKTLLINHGKLLDVIIIYLYICEINLTFIININI